jgi:hypothetical protein
MPTYWVRKPKMNALSSLAPYIRGARLTQAVKSPGVVAEDFYS